jgi:hypothetical protein
MKGFHGWPGDKKSYAAQLKTRVDAAEAVGGKLRSKKTSESHIPSDSPSRDDSSDYEKKAIANCQAAADNYRQAGHEDMAQMYEAKARMIGPGTDTRSVDEYFRLLSKTRKAETKTQNTAQKSKTGSKNDSGGMIWLIGAGLYLAPLIVPPILILKGAKVKIPAGSPADFWSAVLLLGTVVVGSFLLFGSSISGRKIRWGRAAVIYAGIIGINCLIAVCATVNTTAHDMNQWGIGRQEYEELAHPTHWPINPVKRDADLEKLAEQGCPDAKYEIAWKYASDARNLWGDQVAAADLRAKALGLLSEANALNADSWINPGRRDLALQLEEELKRVQTNGR